MPIPTENPSPFRSISAVSNVTRSEHSGAQQRAKSNEFHDMRAAGRRFGSAGRLRRGARRSPARASSPDPTGEWLVARSMARIRIVDCGGQYVGRGGVGEDARRRPQESGPQPAHPADIRHADPARHDADQGQPMGRRDLQFGGRPHLFGQYQACTTPTRCGCRDACSASCAAARTGPAFDRTPTVTPGGAANANARRSCRTRKPAARSKPPDAVDDVCLRLRRPARLPH